MSQSLPRNPHLIKSKQAGQIYWPLNVFPRQQWTDWKRLHYQCDSGPSCFLWQPSRSFPLPAHLQLPSVPVLHLLPASRQHRRADIVLPPAFLSAGPIKGRWRCFQAPQVATEATSSWRGVQGQGSAHLTSERSSVSRDRAKWLPVILFALLSNAAESKGVAFRRLFNAVLESLQDL